MFYLQLRKGELLSITTGNHKTREKKIKEVDLKKDCTIVSFLSVFFFPFLLLSLCFTFSWQPGGRQVFRTLVEQLSRLKQKLRSLPPAPTQNCICLCEKRFSKTVKEKKIIKKLSDVTKQKEETEVDLALSHIKMRNTGVQAS